MVGLLDPIVIRGLKLKNRLVLPPMMTRKASTKGEVTEEVVGHYAERAAGPGLIITEHCYVRLGGQNSETQLGIYDDKLISGWAKLAEAVHGRGAALAAQINHSGSGTTSKVCGMQPVGPSAVKNPKNVNLEVPKAMSVGEIKEMVEAFGEAARRTVDAGLDAVEVHGAHGYLIGQFISPLTNHRRDRYGGTLRNRARFAVEVIQRVREVVGENYPILYRIGCEDMYPGGLTLEEGKQVAQIVAEAGVDVIDVSGGLVGIEPPNASGQGFFIPQAEAIKKVVKVPVIGVGGIKTPEYADSVIRKGRVDLVAVGRAILNDPTWGLRAVEALERG